MDYKLSLPQSLKIHPVFHVDRLTPWGGNDINGKLPPPPEPVEVEGEEEYEVEEIVDSRFHRRKLQYLVKWKGYDDSENSWQSVADVKNAPEAVANFHRKHPSAPRQINAVTFATLPWQTVANLTEGSTTDLEWASGKRVGKASIVRRDVES